MNQTTPDLIAELVDHAEYFTRGDMPHLGDMLKRAADRLEETNDKLTEAVGFWESNRAEVERLKAENERLEKSVRWWRSQVYV